MCYVQYVCYMQTVRFQIFFILFICSLLIGPLSLLIGSTYRMFSFCPKYLYHSSVFIGFIVMSFIIMSSTCSVISPLSITIYAHFDLPNFITMSLENWVTWSYSSLIWFMVVAYNFKSSTKNKFVRFGSWWLLVPIWFPYNLLSKNGNGFTHIMNRRTDKLSPWKIPWGSQKLLQGLVSHELTAYLSVFWQIFNSMNYGHIIKGM